MRHGGDAPAQARGSARLDAASLGKALCRFGAGAAGAGRVRAGTEIIVPPQTIRTKVDLMNFAMDDRRVAMANITTAADSSL